MIVCTPRPRVSRTVSLIQRVRKQQRHICIYYVYVYIYISALYIYIGLVLKRRNVGHGIVRLGKVGKVRAVR